MLSGFIFTVLLAATVWRVVATPLNDAGARLQTLAQQSYDEVNQQLTSFDARPTDGDHPCTSRNIKVRREWSDSFVSFTSPSFEMTVLIGARSPVGMHLSSAMPHVEAGGDAGTAGFRSKIKICKFRSVSAPDTKHLALT